MSTWLFCAVLGIALLGLFLWLVFGRKEKFDTPLLGLLTLSVVLILVSLVQPDSIKYGGIELNTIKRNVEKINNKANENEKLTLEITAMLAWNANRWGAGGKLNEDLATNILRDLYGDKALDYRYALQKKGVFLTPKAELEKIPETPFPKGVQSPLYEHLKNLRVTDSR